MTRLLAIALCLILSACLLPNDYDAEVSIGRDGTYLSRFEGDLVQLFALRDLKAGRIDEAGADAAYAQALAEIGEVASDTRKSATVHRVAIERRGRLAAEAVTPLPGPARFLLVEYKGGEALVVTPMLTEYQRRQLQGFGSPSRGRVCIRTDGEVLAHNAETTPEAAGGCYGWDLDLLAGDSIEMKIKL